MPRTSTFALTNATLPYAVQLANLGPFEAVRQSPALRGAANTLAGKLTCEPVARAFDMDWSTPEDALQAAV